ncbi:MAG: hypothetical protein WBP10_18260 [Thermoanaerobaculia bacterium]|jgi:uncharacterized membrane protein YheB (UPF0754 family)
MELLRDLDFWKHVSIPFVAGIVGWATNWVAIKLTFLPLEFRGIRPYLGWQGIIPSKAGKMAGIFAESTMFRLGTLGEIFRHMDPEAMADHISEVIEPRLDGYTDEVMFYGGQGALWRSLPSMVKSRIYSRVRDEMPALVHDLMQEIGEHIEDLVDFKHMLVTLLEGDKVLLNRLFIESGEEEFKFIIRSGLYFGFIFGLAQLAFWIFYKGWWVLPFFGGLVGYATNWIAINLIFRPLHPKKIGPWTVQGLFLKRQREVAGVWTHLVTREVVTLHQIIEAMLTGPESDKVEALIKKHIEPISDEALGSFLPAAQLTVGSSRLVDIRQAAGDKAVEVSIESFKHWGFNEDRAEVLGELLQERMADLPPDEFQDLLRPCFQEDEWKLILMGGVLGLLAGLAQLVFVFGGLSSGF